MPQRLLIPACFSSKGHVLGVEPATLRLMILVDISFLRKHFIEEFNLALFNNYHITTMIITDICEMFFLWQALPKHFPYVKQFNPQNSPRR